MIFFYSSLVVLESGSRMGNGGFWVVDESGGTRKKRG
jgi:hypothetical protein